MPDYAFYCGVYGGGLGADAFAGCLPVAVAYMERVERLYTVSYPTPDSRDKAVCAVAEQVWLTKGSDGSRTPEERVKQVKVGSVSTTYEPAKPEKAEVRYYEAARLYADIYRGANP